MKIAVFGDLHAHNYREFDERSDKTGSKRLDNILDILDQIKEYCLREGITTTLFAGDMFEVRSRVNTSVFNATYDKFKEMCAQGLKIVAIPGNHDDMDNSDLPQHSLHAFKDIQGMKVIDDLGSVILEDGTEVIGIRYSKNTEMIKNRINNIPEDGKKRILLGHLGIAGGLVGKSNYAMQDAFSVNDLRPDLFQYIVLGHYHKAQFLGIEEHVFYTGAPIQHSFRDEGEDKGFHVIDTSEPYYIEFIPLQAPIFVTLTMENSTKEVLDEHLKQGNYIRAYLREDEVQEFISMAPQGLKYKVHLDKEYKEESRVDVKVGMGFEEIITTYAKEFNPEALDIGLRILKEVEGE